VEISFVGRPSVLFVLALSLPHIHQTAERGEYKRGQMTFNVAHVDDLIPDLATAQPHVLYGGAQQGPERFDGLLRAHLFQVVVPVELDHL
jgi:hypothetical protein